VGRFPADAGPPAPSWCAPGLEGGATMRRRKRAQNDGSRWGFRSVRVRAGKGSSTAIGSAPYPDRNWPRLQARREWTTRESTASANDQVERGGQSDWSELGQIPGPARSWRPPQHRPHWPGAHKGLSQCSCKPARLDPDRIGCQRRASGSWLRTEPCRSGMQLCRKRSDFLLEQSRADRFLSPLPR